MNTSDSARPRVLVVEDDPGIRDALSLVLDDEGYAVQAASSLKEALALVDTQSFGCILTDLFAAYGADQLASVAPLQQRVYPTPIIVVTARQVEVEEAERRGFSRIIAKPFDLDDLVTAVAGCLAVPLNPVQDRQARVVHAYFEALTTKDWDALMSLCTDDVTYVLPGTIPFSGTAQGKAGFRAYTEDTYRHFPDAAFDDVHVYARPLGLAARFHGRWHAADGSEQQQSGAVLFRFTGERIAHIGIELNTSRLEELTRLLR